MLWKYQGTLHQHIVFDQGLCTSHLGSGEVAFVWSVWVGILIGKEREDHFGEDMKRVVSGHTFQEFYCIQEEERWAGSWRERHSHHLCAEVLPKHSSRVQGIQKK